MCNHFWVETGVQRKHVEGSLFRYGTPVVTYVKCDTCGQPGFRRPNSRVVYLWHDKQEGGRSLSGEEA